MRALWTVRVEIAHANGEAQTASIYGDQLTTLKEVSAVLERARALAAAMQHREPEAVDDAVARPQLRSVR